ncbi:MAG TPA: TIGR03032 family protein [Thermoguttaceae bacterium]|nr:TIGR03032 family protein [Thermoguttaceae bacterium]
MNAAAELPASANEDRSSGSGQTVHSSTTQREVRYEHSLDLAGLLEGLDASLLISTYQAGKLVVIGSHRQQLALSFHNFDRPMGVAIDPRANRMAVAARNKVWFLKNARDVAQKLKPEGGHGACFLTRSAQVTGEIQAHEMAWAGDELWIVNTLFSCLCRLHPDFSFLPRWQPPFISALAPEDRCHLNGLALLDGKPKYVTAMAESDTPGGWRPKKAETGCLIDVESGETVARGFAMPHSPRVHAGHVWLLDSGRGELVRVDPADGTVDTVARFPGYTRGLALIGTLAFVGLSKIRETSTFGGVPIAENRERLKCGVGIVDLQTGELAGQFEFTSGVDEIFDVTILPGARLTAMRGPFAGEDGAQTIWTVPAPGEASCRDALGDG